MLLPHTTKDHAARIAEKIRSHVARKKLSYVESVFHATVSIGVAAAKADALPATRALIRAADEALYDAKKTGKNKVCRHKSEK